MSRADTAVILDFETSGLSPNTGDRAIEIGAVKIVEGKIVDRFQSLINPGMRISPFIEDYTGISNALLRDAPNSEHVMTQFADFINGFNLVAHNASFDKRFLDAELQRASQDYMGSFSCSMLVSRRLLQNAPNHQLATLIRYAGITTDGSYHRALFDSEMTTKLWLYMLDDIRNRYDIEQISFSVLQKLSKKTKKSVHSFLESCA